MGEQEPAVGRIVHYRVPNWDSEGRHNGLEEGDVLPAMIVRVWSGNCVNLKVFLDGEGSVWRTSVSQGSHPGCRDWPQKS